MEEHAWRITRRGALYKRGITVEKLWEWATAGLGTIIIGTISGWIAAGVRTRWAIQEEMEKSPIRMKEEKFKGEVRALIDDGLQNAKYQLERERLVHEVKFKTLHERVAKVLDETFVLINDTYIRAKQLVADVEYLGAPTKQELFGDVIDKGKKLVDYITANELFIPPRIEELIGSLMNSLNMAITDMRREFAPKETRPEADYWGRAVDRFNKETRPRFKALKKEMQETLGLVEKPEKAKTPQPVSPSHQAAGVCSPREE